VDRVDRVEVVTEVHGIRQELLEQFLLVVEEEVLDLLHLLGSVIKVAVQVVLVS
jgi:hypothetical protein